MSENVAYTDLYFARELLTPAINGTKDLPYISSSSIVVDGDCIVIELNGHKRSARGIIPGDDVRNESYKEKFSALMENLGNQVK